MLNAHLEVPFMEAKGAYHIIAEILGFEHLGKGIFQDKEGNKFYLDKYGFHDVEVYNFKERCKELEAQLERLIGKEKPVGQVAHLQEQIERLEKKIENQKKLIADLEDKNKKNKQHSKERLQKARETVSEFTSYEFGQRILEIVDGDRTNTKKIRMIKELFHLENF